MFPSLPQSVASTAFKNALAPHYHTAQMSSGLSSTGISQRSCLVHRTHFCLCSISVLYQSVLGCVHWLENKDGMCGFLLLNVFEPLEIIGRALFL